MLPCLLLLKTATNLVDGMRIQDLQEVLLPQFLKALKGKKHTTQNGIASLLQV